MVWRIIGVITLITLLIYMISGCNSTESFHEKTAYFLVAEHGKTVHGDSYILPLTDSRDITTARSIIAGMSPAKIVVATIAPGSSAGVYVNKDLLGRHTWNWHIVAFKGFKDVTIEILDGWPGYVDSNLNEWITMTDGKIGFWSYTVTREVTLTEMH